MAGHNKWSSIKHRKAAVDSKRGKLFTKLLKEITVAARIGGGDPDGNSRLRKALTVARTGNVPADNVDRAIKRGTGELAGVEYTEITYEGYGPGGAAVIIETMTDNRNRTVGELRHMLAKFNGNLGEAGSVAWMFEKRGIIAIEKEGTSEEAVMDQALEVGAEDVSEEDECFEVVCDPNQVDAIADKLKETGLTVASAEALMIPQNTVKLEGRQAESMIKLMGFIEDHDDVQNVWANFDIDDELIEKLA
jgi:YebC/PmpR family DNA-binding regulatory protein